MRVFIIIAGSFLALSFAFYFQYIRGLHPCELCIWQRWGYAAVILACLLSFSPQIKFAKTLITLLLALETALAIYHTGIEQHWWEGFTTCSSSLSSGQSLEEIKAKLMSSPLVRCDEPQWYFLTLSMAAWNAIYAFGLSIISLTTLSSSGLTRGSGLLRTDPRVKPEDDKGE